MTQAFGTVIDAVSSVCSGKEEDRSEWLPRAGFSPWPALPSPPEQLESLQTAVFSHHGGLGNEAPEAGPKQRA